MVRQIIVLADMKTLQEIRVECKAAGEYLRYIYLHLILDMANCFFRSNDKNKHCSVM